MTKPINGVWILSAAMMLVVIFISVYIFVYRDFNTTSGDISLITREKIIASTKPGEITWLKDLGQFDQQVVYILHPYQMEVGEKSPHAEKINAYLRSVKYVGKEGCWSLVFVDDVQVRLVTFKRAAKLDVLGSHELSDQTKQGMPPAFQPADGVEAEQATFYTILKNDRRYIVLGKISKEAY